MLDLAVLGQYARAADADLAGVRDVGMLALRNRLLLGRRAAYCVGLDGEVGGSAEGLAYGVTGYIAGAGARWGDAGAIALCGGANPVTIPAQGRGRRTLAAPRLLVPLLLAGACAAPPYRPARPLAASVEAEPGVVHRTGLFRGAGGALLAEQSWRPAGRRPRALVVVHHGLKDHSSRYGELARRLVARGFAVFAYDMRGHGHSAGHRATLDDFGQLVADLDIFLARVRRREPGRPVFLLGHSVGGAVVTLYTIERRPPLAGLVVLPPALRVDRPPLAAAATPVAGALLPNLPVVDTPDRLFSRSPDVVRGMAHDPLVHHEAGPARTAAALTAALARIWPRAGELDTALLGLHGTADQLTCPRGTAELVRRARTRDRTLLLYRGLYHDLVHEPERDQVMADIERWLERRAPARHRGH